MKHKNLVISAVGDQSVHATWLSDPEAREFDVCLIYFGDQKNRYAKDADYYFTRKGVKLSMIHEIAEEGFGEVLSGYEMIWIPDDDIAADTHQINELFRLAKKHRLQIAQPAIGEGDVSYEALRWHHEYLLRCTGFVEMMCPLFTADAFARVLPILTENVSGWGLDWVWSSMYSPREVGVIDAIAVHHTRPVSSGGVHRRFAQLGVDPGKEFKTIRRKLGIRNRRQLKAAIRETRRMRAIATDGSLVWTRSLWPWR